MNLFQERLTEMELDILITLLNERIMYQITPLLKKDKYKELEQKLQKNKMARQELVMDDTDIYYQISLQANEIAMIKNTIEFIKELNLYGISLQGDFDKIIKKLDTAVIEN